MENKNGQLATALSNIPQDNLLNNTKDPKREGKEYCKGINLRFGKDVHILVKVPKRRVEPNSTQGETQIEKETQQPIFQHTGGSCQAIATTKKHESVLVEEEAAAPAIIDHNRAREKQFVQSAAIQQFTHPPFFP